MGWVILSEHFKGIGRSPTNHCWCGKTRGTTYANIGSKSFHVVTKHACHVQTDRIRLPRRAKFKGQMVRAPGLLPSKGLPPNRFNFIYNDRCPRDDRALLIIILITANLIWASSLHAPAKSGHASQTALALLRHAVKL